MKKSSLLLFFCFILLFSAISYPAKAEINSTNFTFDLTNDADEIRLEVSNLSGQLFENELILVGGTLTETGSAQTLTTIQKNYTNSTLNISVSVKLLDNTTAFLHIELYSDQNTPLNDTININVKTSFMPYRMRPWIGWGPWGNFFYPGYYSHGGNYPEGPVYAPTAAVFNDSVGQVVTFVGEDMLDGSKGVTVIVRNNSATSTALTFSLAEYDNNSDNYVSPVLQAEESINYSFTIEPSYINATSVEQKTMHMIDIAVSHLRSNFSARLPIEYVIGGHGINPKNEEVTEELAQAFSEAHTHFAETSMVDQNTSANCLHIGIGCESEGGQGLKSSIQEDADLLRNFSIDLLAYSEPTSFTQGGFLYDQHPGCIARNSSGDFIIEDEKARIDLRNSTCRQWVRDKLVNDALNNTNISGYRVDVPFGATFSDQLGNNHTLNQTNRMAIRELWLDVKQAIKAQRPDFLIIFNTDPHIWTIDIPDFFIIGDMNLNDVLEHTAIEARLNSYFAKELLGNDIMTTYCRGKQGYCPFFHRYGVRNKAQYYNHVNNESQLFFLKTVYEMGYDYEILDETLYVNDGVNLTGIVKFLDEGRDILMAGAHGQELNFTYTNITNPDARELYYMPLQTIVNNISSTKVESISADVPLNDSFTIIPVQIEIKPRSDTAQAVVRNFTQNFSTTELATNTSLLVEWTNYSAGAELFLEDNISISIDSSFNTTTSANTSPSLLNLSRFVNISINNTQNISYWIIRIGYMDSELASLDINESSLEIQYFNETSGTWVSYSSSRRGINTTGNYAWLNITHFSLFGLFGLENQEEEDIDGSSPLFLKGSSSPLLLKGGGSPLFLKAAPPPIVFDIDEEYNSGDEVEQTLSESDSVTFTQEGNSYEIELESIEEGTATLDISSFGSITMEEGDTYSADLDGDGDDDIEISAERVGVYTADITFQMLAPPEPLPPPEDGYEEEETEENASETYTTQEPDTEIPIEGPEQPKPVSDYGFILKAGIAIILFVVAISIFTFRKMKMKQDAEIAEIDNDVQEFLKE